jgi:hypothetical protein
MNGFGFIEYKDAMDARDVVPGKMLNPLYLTLTQGAYANSFSPTAFRMYSSFLSSRNT